MDVRIKHLSGLGFTPGSYVTIKRSGEQLGSLNVGEQIRNLKFFSDGNTLVTASTEGWIRLWRGPPTDSLAAVPSRRPQVGTATGWNQRVSQFRRLPQPLVRRGEECDRPLSRF